MFQGHMFHLVIGQSATLETVMFPNHLAIWASPKVLGPPGPPLPCIRACMQHQVVYIIQCV